MVYRSRRRFYKRRLVYKKRQYRRFRRSRRIRVLKNKRSGNIYKLTVKKSFNTTLRFYVDNASQSSVNITKFERDIQMADFFTNNHEIWDRIHDYHYIKFNYFIIKFPEITYVTYSGVTPTGIAKQAVTGISSFNTERYPFHVAWDVEQALDFNAQDASFDAKELSEYPFAKKVYPSQKRAPYFMWRVPSCWRQYIDTNAVQPLMFNNIPFYNFFQNVTGIKNVRSPTKILGGHENWWGNNLPSTVRPDIKPSDSDTVFMQSFLKCELIASVTFRGVKYTGRNS
ncbi:putative capsid protein [Golden silk orbweaver associated circular virus 1]|uniref:Putative capsid protein n=1 Tax=Golden silk orbweaver associated circular virus 1 TaxID=2293292 RepID=A0A346BPA5_9VIRU|nr:putative capsid protein [Golden silk orbweaver associated circular virus 1]AXL65902.1 putative capsid protein [Golden silk orbweaver associated circular virus 1]